MQITHPPSEVWKKMVKDFKYQCKQNTELKNKQFDIDFETEDHILFYYQLQFANPEMFVLNFDLISEYLMQIPKLLFALEQNVSTKTSIQILDLLYYLCDRSDDAAKKLIVKNMGLKILLKRIQDHNLDIIQKCTQFIELCFDYGQLLKIGALNIFIEVQDRLDANNSHEPSLLNFIIKLCLESKLFKVNMQVCRHIMKLRNLPIKEILSYLRTLLWKNIFQNHLTVLLKSENFIDRVTMLNHTLDIFFFLDLLSKYVNDQEYILNHNILSLYEVQLDNSCEIVKVYAKTLAIFCSGNLELTQKIIQSQVILDNLFRFKSPDCKSCLVQICNNVMDLKLAFELQYLMTKGILYRYFALLKCHNKSYQEMALKGLRELTRLNHLKNQLISVQNKVCKMQDSSDQVVRDRAKEVLNEISKQKEQYF